MERELSELRQRATRQAADIESYKSQLVEANRAASAASAVAAAGGGGAPGQTFPAPKGAAGGGGVDGPQQQLEIRRLKDENEKLRQELSAFDMDFFEEIENLKHAHAEAVKKPCLRECWREKIKVEGNDEKGIETDRTEL